MMEIDSHTHMRKLSTLPSLRFLLLQLLLHLGIRVLQRVVSRQALVHNPIQRVPDQLVPGVHEVAPVLRVGSTSLRLVASSLRHHVAVPPELGHGPSVREVRTEPTVRSLRVQLGRERGHTRPADERIVDLVRQVVYRNEVLGLVIELDERAHLVRGEGRFGLHVEFGWA